MSNFLKQIWSYWPHGRFLSLGFILAELKIERGNFNDIALGNTATYLEPWSSV